MYHDPFQTRVLAPQMEVHKFKQEYGRFIFCPYPLQAETFAVHGYQMHKLNRRDGPAMLCKCRLKLAPMEMEYPK